MCCIPHSGTARSSKHLAATAAYRPNFWNTCSARACFKTPNQSYLLWCGLPLGCWFFELIPTPTFGRVQIYFTDTSVREVLMKGSNKPRLHALGIQERHVSSSMNSCWKKDIVCRAPPFHIIDSMHHRPSQLFHITSHHVCRTPQCP